MPTAAAGCIAFILLLFCAAAPKADAQVIGYKGKRAMVQYVADLNIGWAISDFGVPEDDGLNLWTHELNISYLVSRKFALEGSVSYARHSVALDPYDVVGSSRFPGYERYNQTTYALGFRSGDVIQPLGFYFTICAYYGRAYSNYPVLREFFESDRGGFPVSGEPLDMLMHAYGIRLEYGLHRAIDDHLILRFATRVGAAQQFPGNEDTYQGDPYYGSLFYDEVDFRFLVNELFSLRAGVGYMF